MPSQAEIREEVTNQIVQALQQGVVPWRKPWSALENTGYPMNAVSKKLYQGINPILLQLAAHKRGYQSKWWATYRQWADMGLQVMKRPSHVPPGKWGTKIIFWKPITTIKKNGDGKDEERTFPLLREYTVFNADQVEGEAVEKFRVHPPTCQTVIDYEPAEKVIEATKADIRQLPCDLACYYGPPLDFIQLPLKSLFADLPSYYDTAFHELTHWTEPRLNWTGSYAFGELRAELGSAFLTAAVSIPQVDDRALKNVAAYLNSWIKAMQADHKVIFQISSAASKACDFILSFGHGAHPEEQPEEVAAF
jgi:antirestriction protein ArdC